jgi:hypothetical protein
MRRRPARQVHTFQVTPATSPKFRARAVDHLALAIGTAKGLFFVSDSVVDGPVFPGQAVSALAEATDRLLAAYSAPDGTCGIRTSDNGGLSWKESSWHQTKTDQDGRTSLGSVCHLHLDRRPDAQSTIWAGLEPAGLLVSQNNGDSFDVVHGPWENLAQQTPGAGQPSPSLHSIITHPQKPNRLVVAISTAGVYCSEDDGSTWVERNTGLQIASAPQRGPAASPWLHAVAVDAHEPDLLWAQSSCGLYISEDAGEDWRLAGEPDEPGGLPSSFALSLISHPSEPDTLYVVPLESERFACTAQGRCRVYRSVDRATSWTSVSTGLPCDNAYLTILRDALTVGSKSPCPLVFGSQSGDVFASMDGGDSWRVVTSYLPPILCVQCLS